MGTILTILIAVSLVFGGAGATVYAAQDSLPGEPLYQVKTATENARMQMTGSEEAQFNLALQFAHQRMEEYQAMVKAGEPVSEPFMNAFQHQWQEALRLAGGLEDDETLQGALERARVQLQLQEQTMTMLHENQPEDVDPTMQQVRTMLQAQLRRVEEGLEDPAQFRARIRTGVPEDVEPGPVETPPPGDGGGPGPVADPGSEPAGDANQEQNGPGPQGGPEAMPGPELGAGPQNGSDNPVGPGPQAGTADEQGQNGNNPQTGDDEQNGNPDTGAEPGGNPDTGGSDSGGSSDNGGGSGGSRDSSGGSSGGDSGGSSSSGGSGGGGGGKK